MIHKMWRCITRPFSKISFWAYLWINSLPFGFIIYQVQCFRNTLKLSCRPLAFTSYKGFFKKQICLELVSLSGCLYFWDILQYMCYKYLLTKLWRHKFWNQPYNSNQAVFLHDQRAKTKFLISWERKEFFLRQNKTSTFQGASP